MILALADLESWPTGLRRSVQDHGPAIVYQVGFEVLGYPPTWRPTNAEQAKVREAIAARFSQLER